MQPNEILDHAIQFLGRKSQASVPAMLQPLRDVGNSMGQTLADLRPNTSPSSWNNLTPQERIANIVKAAVSYGGQGLVQGGANSLAGAISTSPPAQLVEYAMGKPDLQKQASHAMEGILGALTLGKYLESPAPVTNYLRNNLGQFSTKPITWVTDLMGGVR